MQNIIELGRVSRERRVVGLKSPLKSLVVVHSDPLYIEDIRSLEGYIARALNVHQVITTSDEAEYNVCYSVTADWPVLGKKLKKRRKTSSGCSPLAQQRHSASDGARQEHHRRRREARFDRFARPAGDQKRTT